jgi:fucose permease
VKRFGRYVLLTLAYVAFVSLGLPDGVLGVAWPSMRASFGVPVDGLGVLLASATVGYLVSSLASGWLVQRMGVGMLLILSSALVVANSWGYAVLTAWSAMAACALLAGLGAGAIDAGINAFAASRFSAGTVTWFHASYGVGATLGPLLMTATLTAGLSWRWGYGVLGLVLAGMTLAFSLTRSLWNVAPTHDDGHDRDAAGFRTAITHPPVWSGVVLFFVYTGLEVAAGQWTYSLLTEARGVTPAMAGTTVATYWGSFTGARLIAGILAGRVQPQILLRGTLILAVVGGTLLWVANSAAGAVVALAVLGAALAPIYPLLMADTPGRLGDRYAIHAIGFQVAAAYLGAAAIPGGIGVVAARHGVEVVAPSLLGVAVIVLILYETTVAARRRPGLATQPLCAPAASHRESRA